MTLIASILLSSSRIASRRCMGYFRQGCTTGATIVVITEVAQGVKRLRKCTLQFFGIVDLFQGQDPFGATFDGRHSNAYVVAQP